MTTMEAIGADVAAIGNGLTVAAQCTARADQAAQQIATRSAASGFIGIARNLAGLREAIRDIHVGIATVTNTVGEASTAIAAAPRQPTPKQTTAVLDPLVQKLDAVHGGIGAVMDCVAKAQQRANAALEGGQPGPMLARLDEIRQTLLAVAQRKEQAKKNVDVARAEARKVGDQGNS